MVRSFDSQDFIKLTAQYTVARMIERDDFQKRYQGGVPISLHEFLYPLCQGYDSVYLKSDLELGGTDQKFNLLVGRDLQKSYGQKVQQGVVTCPLLEGLDGVQKMSKSYDNFISVVDSPRDMFGKTMRISDELMFRWYELLTLTSPQELALMKTQVEQGQKHPRDLKVALAKFFITRFHSFSEAQQAEEEFDRVFAQKGLPDFIEEKEVPSGSPKALVSLLTELGLTSSNSEAKRLIQGRGVEVDQEKVEDEKKHLDLIVGHRYLLKVGKKKFLKIKIVSS
jgi:tyrosyl-tRNA synthetase